MLRAYIPLWRRLWVCRRKKAALKTLQAVVELTGQGRSLAGAEGEVHAAQNVPCCLCEVCVCVYGGMGGT